MIIILMILSLSTGAFIGMVLTCLLVSGKQYESLCNRCEMAMQCRVFRDTRGKVTVTSCDEYKEMWQREV